jgi:hypothetical protein
VLEQARRLLFIERGDLEPPDEPLPRQLREAPGERVRAFLVAHRRDDENAGATAGDCEQELERRLVGPVHVVQHEREGPLGRAEQPGYRIVEPKLLLARAECRCGRKLMVVAQQRRNDGGEDRGVAVEAVAQPLEVGRESLCPRAVGRCPVFVRRSPEHDGSASRGAVLELACEPRLADAGLPGEDHDGGIARGGALEQAVHRLELGLAADEGGPLRRSLHTANGRIACAPETRRRCRV